MVHAAGFSLHLVSGGQKLPEIEHATGTFAVAVPGQEFDVHLATPGAVPDDRDLGVTYRAYLYLDGTDVGYRKILARGHATSWTGYMQAMSAEGAALRAFKFARPRQQDDAGTEEEDEAAARGGGAAAGRAVVEFFLAPSLASAAGSARVGTGMTPFVYKNVGPRLVRLELRYETAGTLLLRGVLDPARNPHHQAIVDAAAAAEAAAGDGEERGGGSGAGPLGHGLQGETSSAREGRQQRGVKREREEGCPGLQGEPEVIDLTADDDDRPRAHPRPAAPSPNDQVLAAKREGKELTCELTAEEDAPEWREEEQQTIRLSQQHGSTASLDSLPAGKPCSTEECMDAATAHLAAAGLDERSPEEGRPPQAAVGPPHTSEAAAGKPPVPSRFEPAAHSPPSPESPPTSSGGPVPRTASGSPITSPKGRVAFADERARYELASRSSSKDSMGRAQRYDSAINAEAAGIQVDTASAQQCPCRAKWEDVVGYSRAVRKGNHIFVSGTSAVEQATGRVMYRHNAYKQARGAGPVLNPPLPARRQARLAFTIIERALEKLGASLNDVVRTRLYLKDMAHDSQGVSMAHGEVLGEVRPASTMVQVARWMPSWSEASLGGKRGGVITDGVRSCSNFALTWADWY
eukprot:scaffold14.g1110.t1